MGDKTKIEWTDATWNPSTGCTKVSAGCKFCYAERDFHRPYPGRAFTDVRTHPDRLDQPLHWKRPRRIFVNSMSDLFHDAIPDDFLDSAFTVMALCGQHRFQVLTKRPERMARYIDRLSKSVKPLEEKARERGHTFMFAGHGLLLWPLRNIWLGVSVEDQKTADERIPLLLQTPAAVRFISYEPALGPVDLSSWLPLRCCNGTDCGCMGLPINPPYLNWTIAGGESGAHARPSHPDWFRKVRNDCQAAGVPLFFKQWGEWAIASSENGIIGSLMPETGEYFTWIGIDGKTQNPSSHGLSGSIYSMAKIGKKRSGRLLDGREWREFPDAKWSELPEIT